MSLISTPSASFISRYSSLSSTKFTLVLALFLTVFYNASFFGAVKNLYGSTGFLGVVFTLNLAVLVCLLSYIVLSLIVVPYVAKPAIILVLCSAAAVAYFMKAYGIVIHRNMILNTLETDVHEVRSLINTTFLTYLLLLGVLPSLLVTRLKITFAGFWQELWIKFKTIGIVFGICLLLIFAQSSAYASFFRNHKDIRQMVNPLNFIYAGLSFLSAKSSPDVIKPIGEDAHLGTLGLSQSKPILLIVVVGEAARADHFSTNGYARDTTPLIRNENIINYSSFNSCGTETAVSVPCMFSLLTRNSYSDSKAKSQESVLDVISHAGVPVLWRDNNSSCKGVCDRVGYERLIDEKVPDVCNERECFDNILLHQLDEKLQQMPAQGQGHKLIVLHQKGSHGPDYYQRYPAEQEVFSPVCDTNQLSHCSKEQVVNAYDNTIHYTDQFLAKTIEWLKHQENNYNTAMVYLADHGESLGENGLYLHGMPYLIAPQEQKHVPFFFWFSSGFERDGHIDRQCLMNQSSKEYSQDNLFHTLLGLMNIETAVYSPQLDMIKECR